MAVLHFFLVNSPLIYILFSMGSIDYKQNQDTCLFVFHVEIHEKLAEAKYRKKYEDVNP